MKTAIKKMIYSKSYYTFLACYLFMAFIVIIFSVNFFNKIRSFTNKYVSMSPVINAGTVIVVKKYNQYQVGDIITYYFLNQGKEEIITHRILWLGGNVYVTKGDTNKVADREVVLPRLIIGKVIIVIPYLGYLVSFAKGPVGIWLIIVFPAIAIISSEICKIYLEKKEVI